MNERIKIIAVVVFLMTVTVYQIAESAIMGPTPTVETVKAQGFEEVGLQNVETIVVNEEAVRVRILPHSNAYQDQLAKRMVSFAIDEFLAQHAASLDSVETTRQFIQLNIAQIETRINQVLQKINYELGFEVSYGAHLFPEKHHNGQVLPAGYYESLVIRIGEGRGNNWWCFINPGMCLGPNAQELTEGTTQENWNFQNQLLESTQEAIRNQNFTSYISGIVDSFLGTTEEIIEIQPEFHSAIVENNAEFDWFLFEDER